MNRLEELKKVELGEKIGFKKGYEQAKKEFERPHGEWILDAVSPHSISWFRCSYCGYKYNEYKESNFCPNCGSDNRPKEGETE